MEQSTFGSHSFGHSSDLAGSLLLTSAGLLLIGAWAAMVSSPALRLREEVWTGLHPMALEVYEEACDRGDATACNDLGVSYERGYGTTEDDPLALQIFERACRLGSAEACNNQGALLEEEWSPVRDPEVVPALYRHACESGSALGCSNLGALYARGKGVEQNREEARWLFARACQLGGATGCENLATILEGRQRREAH
jgi:TPR repeat protein